LRDADRCDLSGVEPADLYLRPFRKATEILDFRKQLDALAKTLCCAPIKNTPAANNNAPDMTNIPTPT